MRVLLLGPLEMKSESGTPVRVSAPKRRALLSALALEANREVATSRLLTLLWREPPVTARAALQGHVAALRKILSSDGDAGLRVVTGTSGYRLVDDGGRVDVHSFHALCAEAADTTETTAIGLLRQALGLWRGAALDGCGSEMLQETAGPGLEEARLATLESLATRLLRLRRGEEAVQPLREAVRSNPLREPLVAALMQSYRQAGADAAALALFDDTARRLQAALGTEPGPALRAAHRELRATSPSPKPRVRAVRPPLPAMLPRIGHGFVGRRGELAWLDVQANLPEPPLILVSGPAGVGKTGLALRWAHGSSGRFPDGELYVDLRGFDEGEPLEPAAALAALLRALGTPDDAIPVDLDERAARYRTLLAGRRMLVLLDNARSYHQVRRLLPDGPGPVTVVTSRDRLGDLIINETAAPITLGPLTPDEAQDLLAQVIARSRLTAEPEAAARIIAACDRLPLALRIVAARLAAHPTWQLAQMAAELADEHARLTVLAIGRNAGVTAALNLTYRTLASATARLFCLLGLHPGADIDVYAVAALTQLPVAQAHTHLASLNTAHLIQEPSPGRFALHDLVRLYARELAGQLPDEQRGSAFERLLDQYLAATHQADLAVHTLDPPPRKPAGPPAGALPSLATPTEVRAWFHCEEPAIRALIAAAPHHGRSEAAWRLAWQAGDLYLMGGGDLHEWEQAAASGLNAAERDGSVPGQAVLHSDIGTALMYGGRFEAALEHMERSVKLADQAGRSATRQRCLARLANCLIEAGKPERAVTIQEDLVTAVEQLNDDASTAKALNNLAHGLIQAGRPLAALTHAERAVALVRNQNHLIYPYLIYGLQTGAEALHALGRFDEALRDSARAMELAHEAGASSIEAHCAEFVGAALRHLGRHAEAAVHWRSAIDLYTQQGRPTGVLSGRLAELDAGSATAARSAGQ